MTCADELGVVEGSNSLCSVVGAHVLDVGSEGAKIIRKGCCWFLDDHVGFKFHIFILFEFMGTDITEGSEVLFDCFCDC